MKLYVIVNSWETKYTPKLFEVDVVEKPKSYILVNNKDRWKFDYVSRINKSIVGRIYNDDTFIALTAQEAVKGYRDCQKKQIEKYEKKLDALKVQLAALDDLEKSGGINGQ